MKKLCILDYQSAPSEGSDQTARMHLSEGTFSDVADYLFLYYVFYKNTRKHVAEIIRQNSHIFISFDCSFDCFSHSDKIIGNGTVIRGLCFYVLFSS